jgi:hypothetical protein
LAGLGPQWPSADALMGMPDLQPGAQALAGVQQDRELLAFQMASDPRTSHLTLIDNPGGGNCLILALLQSGDPTAPADGLRDRAQQIRQILQQDHPEHFLSLDSISGQVSFYPDAYLDINAPNLLDSLLGAVFGENPPQVSLIYPRAEGGLMMHTVGPPNPELGNITLADLAGHYMAAVPNHLLWPGMAAFSSESPFMGRDAPAFSAGQSSGSAQGSWVTGSDPSTVARLATEVSGAVLLSALIQQRNSQDFDTQRPLPSGASVHSQALSSEAANSGTGHRPASHQTSKQAGVSNPATNRVQQRGAESQLQPAGGAARSHTGPGTRRPEPTNAAHTRELKRLASSVPPLQSHDRRNYSAFMAYLENTGPSVRPGEPAIHTLAEFNALALADQNMLVNAAIAAGLHGGTRQAINRAQERDEKDRLQPPGGAARSHTAPRTRRPAPTHAAHTAELDRLASVPGLHPSDRSHYSAFLAYLENTGPSVRPGETAIRTLADFIALPLTDRNTLVNAAIASGLHVGARQAINRALELDKEEQLHPPCGAVPSHTGPKPRRPVPTNAAHTAEVDRLASIPGLKAYDRSHYSAFLAYLENTGPSVQPGGAAIRTLAEFNALSLADQNTLVNAAIGSGLHIGARQAINRAQERDEKNRLQPPYAARSHTEPRPRRPVPTNAAHTAEADRLASIPGLKAYDRSHYSAFMAYLENTGPSVRPGEPAIRTLAEFNALSLADQNTLVNAAIDSGLDARTCATINRAQQRPAEQQLQRSSGKAGGASLAPYTNPGAPPDVPATPAAGPGFVIGEVDCDEESRQ